MAATMFRNESATVGTVLHYNYIKITLDIETQQNKQAQDSNMRIVLNFRACFVKRDF